MCRPANSGFAGRWRASCSIRGSRKRGAPGTTRSRSHQEERIGAERDALPGGGIAFSKPHRACAAGEHELVAVEPPRAQPKPCDRGIAALLDEELVGVLAGLVLGERERAERLAELAQEAPVAKH